MSGGQWGVGSVWNGGRREREEAAEPNRTVAARALRATPRPFGSNCLTRKLGFSN